jgi:type III secretory pathway component EscV
METVSRIESRRILAGLGVMVSEEVIGKLDGVSPRYLLHYGERLIDESVAGQIWCDWHSGDQRCEQEIFRHAFMRLLIDAYALGLRLDRFREMSVRLPEPGSMNEWIDAFEACVASASFGTVRLTVGADQFSALQASNRQSDPRQSWDGLLERTSDEIFDQLGLVYPTPRVETDSSLRSPWFRCDWNDLTLPQVRGLTEQQILVNDTVARLTLLNVKGEEAVHPVTGEESAIVDASYTEVMLQAGLLTWTWLEYMGLYLSGTIRRAANAFVSRQLYDLYSLRLREFAPILLECLEARFRPPFVTQVIRALVADGISVKNLPEVFRAMLELRALMDDEFNKYIVFTPPTGGVGPSLASKLTEMTPRNYADWVRMALKRHISHLYARGSTLIVYLLTPDAEKRFARGLTEAERRAFLKAAGEEIGSLPPTAQMPVVLTTVEVRHTVWRTMFPEFPRIVVVSYQELSPDLNIQPIARITPEF